jgi:hypothetical protein
MSTTEEIDFTLKPIGMIESNLVNKQDAPCQGFQGAPEAWITINKNVAAWFQ